MSIGSADGMAVAEFSARPRQDAAAKSPERMNSPQQLHEVRLRGLHAESRGAATGYAIRRS
jgi:hypothetical protein